MDTAYITLGKIGDIYSGLAIAQTQDANPHIVVSAQYEHAIRNHQNRSVLDEPWDDLRAAIKHTKRKHKRVRVLQTFGKDFPIAHHRPSFQMDSAMRAGLDWGDHVRLKMDRPTNAASLAKQYLPAVKHILVADHSESSRFPYRDELWKLINERFAGRAMIVRLSDIKLECFSDFLALYDSADALVTIDTAHLHLSSATTTPVLAFSCDSPNKWRGSAWHSRFAFYARYSQFEKVKEEFLNSLQLILDRKAPVKIGPVTGGPAFSYNPSIINWQGKTYRTFRFHPNPIHWRTELWISDGETCSKINPPNDFKEHSIEDGRLFIFRNQLYLSYVVSRAINNVFNCVIQYAQVVKDNAEWKLVNHRQPRYGKNDFSALEKNWVFFEYQNQLYAIYECSPQQVVVQITEGEPSGQFRTDSPQFVKGAIRGGTTPIPYQGQWLRFFHTQSGVREEPYYHVGALLMEPHPPFRITKIGSLPVASGNEQYFPKWKFWKANVLICYGAVEEDGGWRVACGVNDSACVDLIVKPEHLHL